MYKIIDGIKGREVIATQNIEKDTIIIKEYPKIICEDLYDAIYKIYENINYSSDNDDLDDFDIIFEKYMNMTPFIYDKYMITYDELKDEIEYLPVYMKEFFNDFDIHKLQLLAVKFYRNAFKYNTKFGGQSAILFEGSLLNHSCNPNIDFYVDNNGYYIFKANKNIYEGEELCDSYIDVTLSYKKRRDLLLKQYGFICNCEICKNSRCKSENIKK